MVNKVLVPIDLSHVERTDAMFEHIGQLAAQDAVSLILLHVLPKVPNYIQAQLPPQITETSGKEARTSMESLARKYGVDKTSDIRVVTGDPAQSVLKIAADEQVDLVVIGSHQPGAVDFLLGSVASKVVRHAHCSVLIVR